MSVKSKSKFKPSGERKELSPLVPTNCSPTTDRERWEAVGRPEIICHDKCDENGCMYIGPDVDKRVCEVCGANEPKRETDKCPKCKLVTWWVPKCPKCGGRCTWTYGEIKPMEYERILSANAPGERPAGHAHPTTPKTL